MEIDGRSRPDPLGDDHGPEAQRTEATLISCPYCGEPTDLLIDPAGGPLQEYVEDCPVCCQPWAIRVALDFQGRPSVYVGTLDDR